MDMKAAVVKEPGVLEVREVPVPKPGPYEVLCKMEYGATCAGTDIHLTDGKHPFPVSFPTILGHESCGRVVEAGSKVKNFKEGDLVTRVGAPAMEEAGIFSNWGGFAEYGIAKDHWEMRKDGIPKEEWDRNRVNQVVRGNIDPKTAPMIITWRETMSYSRRIGVTEGTKLLVIGSGANAFSFACHGGNLGAEVVAIGSEKRRESYEKLPIKGYFDYKDMDTVQKVSKLEEGGYDIIIDGVGASSLVTRCLPMLKDGGTIGVYGWNDRAGYALNPFGATSSFSVYSNGYDEEETNELVQSMILRGVLDASLWYDIDNPVPLDGIVEAYESLRRHEAFKYLIEF